MSLNQNFCDLCHKRTTDLIRRYTFTLCPCCYAQEERNMHLSAMEDTALPPSERAKAKRKAKALTRLISELNRL